MSERFDCSTCVYREDVAGSVALCRRRSATHPAADTADEITARWPLTMTDDWCGEGLWAVRRSDGRAELVDWPAVHLRTLQDEREAQRLAKAEEREQARAAEREGRAPPRGRP